jgi:predicted transposase YbfD/YdcC
MNNPPSICADPKFSTFIEAIKTINDPRDSRGKRHSYEFIITSVIIAMMSGRSTLSSIHRFIENDLKWLKKVTGFPDAQPISRAHLPRFLAKLSWVELNNIIDIYFGFRLEKQSNDYWIAIDGKVMKGTIKGDGEQQTIVHAVCHSDRTEIAQARQIGKKSSEIPVVRDMIKKTGLEKRNLTLDALHCNPITTAQIHQAGGSYLIQVKENQETLLEQCKTLHENTELIHEIPDADKSHGRVTSRTGLTYNINSHQLDKRWKDSGISTLVVIKRDVHQVNSDKTSQETSYYITNKNVQSRSLNRSKNLVEAVRRHWGVESNNWILDVTFNEDALKIKNGNQSQILGRLRGVCANLIRLSGAVNFQAAIESYQCSHPKLRKVLKQLKLL